MKTAREKNRAKGLGEGQGRGCLALISTSCLGSVWNRIAQGLISRCCTLTLARFMNFSDGVYLTFGMPMFFCLSPPAAAPVSIMQMRPTWCATSHMHPYSLQKIAFLRVKKNTDSNRAAAFVFFVAELPLDVLPRAEETLQFFSVFGNNVFV